MTIDKEATFPLILSANFSLVAPNPNNNSAET